VLGTLSNVTESVDVTLETFSRPVAAANSTVRTSSAPVASVLVICKCSIFDN